MLPKEALVSLYYNAYIIQIETFDLRLGTHIKGINDDTILFTQWWFSTYFNVIDIHANSINIVNSRSNN